MNRFYLVDGQQFYLTKRLCDSKRLFGNYLAAVQPTFVSNHNLDVVYKGTGK
ncbi:MAG: hypothetical protein U5N85_20550 [Arcicella sp.]|nr:hypothetical protein [Arcicella sp.]